MMDTTTGQILTPEQVKDQLQKAMLSTGKELELTRRAHPGPKDFRDLEGENPMITVEGAMAEFLPDVELLGKLPDPSCKRCYGVGHLGKNVTTSKYVPCRCTK